MYTIVLAAILTTGNEVPDFGRRGGCRGCYGGCYGWGGCYGGCYGGWGGCYGGRWGGCYGGCWGCYGCGGGCYGCGGCGGGVVYQASGGCNGGTSGGGGGSAARRAGGSAGQAGGSAGQAGGSTEVTQAIQELKTSIEALKKEQTKLRVEALTQTAAELRLKATEQKIDELRQAIDDLKRRLPPKPVRPGVPPAVPRPELPPPEPGKGEVLLEMPADALVFVNERRIDAASVFLTPALRPGQEYDVKIEAAVVRYGKNINRVKHLSIRAGEVVRLAYKDLGPAGGGWTSTGRRAAAPAHITVRLPVDARLTVHGVDCPLTSETRIFDTPVLEPGKKYSYLLKAEVMRDGRPISQTQRVFFRSGERVRVSFEDLATRSLTER
ncbi:MAG TPA: TIGR03000 domain-containing protein [Gemmataceae bacterium]|nr:TIGR03000 domain-containing protein [Gemmataceae bacterium]